MTFAERCGYVPRSQGQRVRAAVVQGAAMWALAVALAPAVRWALGLDA